jgi:hypothetical protein
MIEAKPPFIIDSIDVILYYDGPQIYIAEDSNSNKFLCMLVSETNDSIVYVAAYMDPDIYLEFKEHGHSILDIFKQNTITMVTEDQSNGEFKTWIVSYKDLVKKEILDESFLKNEYY